MNLKSDEEIIAHFTKLLNEDFPEFLNYGFGIVPRMKLISNCRILSPEEEAIYDFIDAIPKKFFNDKNTKLIIEKAKEARKQKLINGFQLVMLIDSAKANNKFNNTIFYGDDRCSSL